MRKRNPARSTTRLATVNQAVYSRRLRFEPLEDRRLLALITGTFANSFGQISRTVGAETMVVTADNAGHTQLFYRPNDELGYVDPANGNLLTLDYLPGTSGVLTIDGVVSGNLSDLVGVKYSNGQVIATNGGLTAYHRDGSIMRQNGVWTYDAGATLEDASGNFYWTNGVSLKSGGVLKHPNGTTFVSGNQIFYGSGATFENSSSALFYPGAQQLRDSSLNYYYQSGSSLKSSNVTRYANGTVMVDSNGAVFNSDGSPALTPFSRTQTFSINEVITSVNNHVGTTTDSIQANSTGETGASASFELDYPGNVPNPLNIAVTAPDATSLHFTWTTGGGSTTSYRVAVSNGVSPPGDPATGADTTNNYFDVTGLIVGQKVSIRVWANDGSGHLSDGVFATGTAGQQLQAIQTGEEIASASPRTFAQVYDSVDHNVIFTIDKDNNSFVWVFVNDEMGYVNIDNGDRLTTDFYVIPGTTLISGDVTDAQVTGNISQIPDGAKYSTGSIARSGNVYYYDNGSILRDASGNWFYSNGTTLKNGTATYWLGGTVAMRSGTSARYPNNSILKSGSQVFYDNGSLSFAGGTAFYRNGTILRTSGGAVAYEGGNAFFSAGVFSYNFGSVLIDSFGRPFTTFGTSANSPYEYSDTLSTSDIFVRENANRIVDYAVSVLSTTSVHVLGGTVDYSAGNGDFNRDNTVGAADYVLYRKTAGSTFNLTADASANGTIDQPDYDTWRAHFGQSVPLLTAAAASASVGLTQTVAENTSLSGRANTSDLPKGSSSQPPTLLLLTSFPVSASEPKVETFKALSPLSPLSEDARDRYLALLATQSAAIRAESPSTLAASTSHIVTGDSDATIDEAIATALVSDFEAV